MLLAQKDTVKALAFARNKRSLPNQVASSLVAKRMAGCRDLNWKQILMRTRFLFFVILLVAMSPDFASSEAAKELPSLEETLSDEIVEDESIEANTESAVKTASKDADLSVAEVETMSINITESSIAPKRLVLYPGATVIWKNIGTVPVQVHFIGKAISTTCKAPRGFSIGGKGVYSSSPIAPGGIASLCFLEPELYVYEIRPPAEKEHADTGKGVVGAVQIVDPK